MLPEISLPKFSTTIKEIKTTFHFRPFMMKEERAILMAKAIGTDIEVRQTIEQVVEACLISNKKIIVEDLPAHIVDYLFMQMYARSNTNVLSVNFHCHANYTKYDFVKKTDPDTGEEYEEEVKSEHLCGHESLNPLDLTAITLHYPHDFEKKKEIKVSDSITLYFNAPKSKSIRNVYKMTETDEVTGEFIHSDEERDDAYSDLIYESIDKVVEINKDGEEIIFTIDDFTKDSFADWIDNAPKNVTEQMTILFSEMPTIYLKTTMRCLRPECQNSTDISLTGARSFLDLC